MPCYRSLSLFSCLIRPSFSCFSTSSSDSPPPSKEQLRQRFHELVNADEDEVEEGFELDPSLIEQLEAYEIEGLTQVSDLEGGDSEEFDGDADDSDYEEDPGTQSIFARLGKQSHTHAGLSNSIQVLDIDNRRPGWKESATPSDWSRLSLEDSQRLLHSAAQISATKLTRVYETLVKEGAEDIAIIRVSEKCNFTDYMIIATGVSHRKLGQLSKCLGETLTLVGEEFGEQASQFFIEDFHEDQGWVVVDATDMIVHLQTEEVRTYYDIERLWAFENQNIQQSMEDGIGLLEPEKPEHKKKSVN